MDKDRVEVLGGVRPQVEALRADVDALLSRLQALEEVLGVAVTEPAAPTGASAASALATPEQGGHHGHVFSKVAWACFVLVGALLLRTATRQAFWTPVVGTAIGLGYCALLLVGPYLIERFFKPLAHPLVFELGGSLLAPLIVLEMVNRDHAVPIPVAATSLGVVVLLSSVLGAFRGNPAVIAVVLSCGLGAVTALGAQVPALGWRLVVLVEGVALALFFAHRRGWAFLRPLILLPAMLTLLGAALVAARWDPARTAQPLLVFAAGAICLLVLLSTLGRLRKLDRFEELALPLAALWFYLLLARQYGSSADLGAAVTALGLLLLLLSKRAEGVASSTLDSLGFGAALLAGVALGRLDSSGLSLGVFALVMQRIGAKRAAASWRTLSLLLLVEGLAILLWRQGVFGAAPRLAAALPLTAGYALLAFLHYLVDRRHGVVLFERWRAGVSLACGLLSIICGVRLVLPLVASEMVVTVGQGVLLGAVSLLTLYAGRRGQLPEAVALGLLGIALMGVKALAWDILKLDGGPMLAGVIFFGVATGATSLILRRVPHKAVAKLEPSPEVPKESSLAQRKDPVES